MKNILLFLSFLILSTQLFSANRRYRIIIRDDPATTMTIGWEQYSGTSPVVYYGTTDYGTAWASYPSSKTVDRSITYRGMNNNFARLTGLTANTIYYFVIHDSEGESLRYWFKTLPNSTSERLAFIAGGDSRTNRTPRQNANTIVKRLRPHAVFFGGDYTDSDSESQWQNWFDDWQNTNGTDGRLIPIVAERGNHEDASTVYNLFDIPSSDEYYKLTFGGTLISLYTLNTEGNVSTQGTWLGTQLAADGAIWKAAQYHRPIYPHNSTKSIQTDQYDAWAPHFYTYGVRLAMEADAHTVKTTWPVIPQDGGGYERDDNDPNSLVFIGEGCWGAPLRANDVTYSFTRDVPTPVADQINWIFVDECTIEHRKVRVANASEVGTVDDSDIFTAPANLDVWTGMTNNPTGIIEISKKHSDFSADNTSVITGATVTFTDASANTPTSWSWTFTGGTPSSSTAQNPSIVYNTVGTYNVVLAATNSCGEVTETKTDYITVVDEAPVADFSADATTVNPGTIVTFTDASTNSPTSWSWTFTGGTPSSSTTQNPTITYNTPGLYDVSLTATNAIGSDTETKTDYIRVNGSASLEIAIANDDDDAEEDRDNGSVNLTSSDLEICYEASELDHQYVGLRFQNVSIPVGATITSAYLEFRADETDGGDVTLTIAGDDVDNSAAWIAGFGADISTRTPTTAVVVWNPAAWTTGTTYTSDGISTIIQEIVDRGGWEINNSLSIIIHGDNIDTDTRVADAYTDNWPAKLHIDYEVTKSWTGGASTTDWATAANWENNSVPGAGDDVTIPTGLSYYPIVDETAACNILTIDAGATVTINTGAALTTSEDIHVYGTLKIDAGTVTTASGMEIHVYSGGTFDLNGGTVNIADAFRTKAGCTIDISGGELNIGDNWENDFDGSPAKGTINLSGGAITVVEDCFFSSSDVIGSMTGPFTLEIGDDFQINSTQWDPPTGGTITITGANGEPNIQSDANNDIIAYNLQFNGSNETFYMRQNTADGNQGVHIYNDLTITDGTVETGNGATSHTNKLVVGNIFSISSGAKFKDAIEDVDTYTVGSFVLDAASIYEYSGNGTQTMDYTLAYGRLNISTSELVDINSTLNTKLHLYILSGGSMTLATDAVVTVGDGDLGDPDEDLIINSGGTLTVNDGTLSIKDHFDIYGAFILTSGTVNAVDDMRIYNGVTANANGGELNITGADKHIEINSGGSFTVNGSTVSVNEDIYIRNDGLFKVDAGTVTVGDNLYVGQGISGVFDLNGGEVNVGADFRSLLGCTVDISGGILDIGEDWEDTGSDAKGNITLTGGTINIVKNCVFDEASIVGIMNGAFELNVGNEYKISNNGWSVTNGTVKIDGGLITSHVDHYAVAHNLIIDGTVEQNADLVVNHDLTINSGGILNVNVNKALTVTGTLTNSGNLVIKSDATGTGSLIVGTTADNVTVERYLSHDRWHYIAGQTNISGNFGTLSMGLTGGVSGDQFYRWEESLDWGSNIGNWVDILNGPNGNNPTMDSEYFVACKGYAINYISSDETLSLSGVPYTSSQSINITKTTGSTNEGANLVGNPFTSTIAANSNADGNNFLSTNSSILDDTKNAIYLWDEQAVYVGNRDDYVTVSNLSDATYIAVGQAFMVVGKNESESLAFNTNMQKHGTTTFYKNTAQDEVPRFYMSVENDEGLYNEILIAFIEGMTKGLDISYDAGKLKGNPDIALYTKLVEDNGVDFAHQALPPLDNTVVAVKTGLDVGGAGNYTFKIKELQSFDETISIKLEDKVTGSIIDFRQAGEYSFFINTPGEIRERFVLHFNGVTGIEDNEHITKATVQTYASNNTLYILNPQMKRGTITIVNLTGQKVATFKLTGDTKQQQTLNVSNIINIVQIKTDNEVISKKVIFK